MGSPWLSWPPTNGDNSKKPSGKGREVVSEGWWFKPSQTLAPPTYWWLSKSLQDTPTPTFHSSPLPSISRFVQNEVEDLKGWEHKEQGRCRSCGVPNSPYRPPQWLFLVICTGNSPPKKQRSLLESRLKAQEVGRQNWGVWGRRVVGGLFASTVAEFILVTCLGVRVSFVVIGVGVFFFFFGPFFVF